VRLVITGAGGFIGKNLSVALAECKDVEVIPVIRDMAETDFDRAIATADAVIHLAGVNRPKDEIEFTVGNVDFTLRLVGALKRTGRNIPVAFASSIQAERNNLYGISKRAAEDALFAYAETTKSTVRVYRFPNVFGKWCRPNYNSAVATFCHNIANGLPIDIHDAAVELKLVYVDDVVSEFIQFIYGKAIASGFGEICPIYSVTVGQLAEQIYMFRDVRTSLLTERVGAGLARALYSTYITYLHTDQFSYRVPKYGDSRGVFIEMLKTRDSGQLSCFTAGPGVTRGGHYHHSKTEKFLVVKGQALFRFRHIVTDETFELTVDGDKPTIVEAIPGWAHDIRNIGDDEIVVVLWANEIFDRQRPDTYSHKV
jgi:UDP-2-acetamido-2,6-beta-L-arabino-hexul-4-ose reductase